MTVADRITIICCVSLAVVLLSTVVVVLIGLFDPLWLITLKFLN